jgi:uncharacterized membrane protein
MRLLIALLLVSGACAFINHVPSRSMKCSLSMSKANDAIPKTSLSDKWTTFHSQFSKSINAKVLPALLGASLSLFTLSPMDVANAARSGGRSGGASFRAPRSMGSGTSLRGSSRGYSGGGYSRGYGPSINIMPSPFFSPFGFGYYGMGFGGGGGLTNLILLGAIAYVVLNNFSRVGGADFGDDDDMGALGNGATVMKLQIAMSTDWAEPGNTIETLTRLAEKNNALSGRRELASLLSESSLALLRRSKDWNACAYEGEKFMFGPSKAEPYFQNLAIRERSKFEEETPSDMMLVKSAANSNSQPTEMVVSLLVALRGSSTAYTESVRSVGDAKKMLQNLAADALTDEGNNVMAVEILWTPSEPGNVLTERDLIEDYPELIKF